MSRQDQLNLYIARLQMRLRTFATVRGAATVAVIALAATVGLTLLLNRYAFPERGVGPARLASDRMCGNGGGFRDRLAVVADEPPKVALSAPKRSSRHSNKDSLRFISGRPHPIHSWSCLRRIP